MTHGNPHTPPRWFAVAGSIDGPIIRETIADSIDGCRQLWDSSLSVLRYGNLDLLIRDEGWGFVEVTIDVVGWVEESPDNHHAGSRKLVIRVSEDLSRTCDTCAAQEGRHYCLIHSCEVKNMDLKVCDVWTGRAVTPVLVNPVAEVRG